MFLIVLLLIAACKKDGNNNIVGDKALIGAWRQYAVMVVQTRDLQYWLLDNNGKSVEFKDNGSVTGTSFPDFSRYSVQIGETIELTNADHTKDERYRYTIIKMTLQALRIH